jgi:hypothetical protein
MRFRDHLPHRTARGCAPCAAELWHCHGTLVLHADGTAECDDAHHCHAREDVHDWWLPCTDLGCGCTGDERPLELELAAAA